MSETAEDLSARCGIIVSHFDLSKMFAIERTSSQDWWYSLSISLKMLRADSDALSERILPIVIVGCMVFVGWKGMSGFRCKMGSLVLVHTLVCVMAVGVTAMPLCSMTQPLRRDGFLGSKQIFEPLWRNLQQYRLINGYGLFRRMTGVGTLTGIGWAGQPPSVVKRPEIILEGLFEGDGEEWTELSFRWKPGNEYNIPRQVAPHQPRYVQ